MMKVYYNFGNKEFDKSGFLDHISENGFCLGRGIITNAEISERKPLSNKGNFLDGGIEIIGGGHYGLNIGGRPIEESCKNYSQFLEEMECKKIGGIFRTKSIIGKEIAYLERGNAINGIIVPESLFEEMLTNPDKKQF
jgi:hypothetical protein